MKDFVVGNEYKDLQGFTWKVVSVEPERIQIAHGFRKKFAQKIPYCGVLAGIFDFQQNRILADKIVPVDDEVLNMSKHPQQRDFKLNTNGETYVNLFKKHQEDQKASSI